MADAFAPQLGTEVRFNQPVETPSAFGALAELGSFFVDNLADTQRRQATAAPKVDTNLATFRAGLEKVEAIRQERGETAAQVAERQLASNFAMAGINFDAAYEDVYTTTTGRQWAGYGQDVQATMLQETLKDPVVQSSYIAGLAVLGPDATQDQLVEYAIGQKATLEAANNEIAKSKAQAGYTWSVSTEAAYGANIDNFLNTSLGALSVNSQQGGRVSPMDVQNMKGQWSQLKVALSRPPNISDDQWKSTQDKIANIDSLLTTFEKASSSEALLEELSTAIATSITAGKEGDLQALIAGASAAKDINLFANLTGVDFATTLMDAGKGLKLDVTQQDLFGHILDDQSSLVGVEDPNSFLSTIPDTVKTRIEGKTPEEIFNGLDASGKLAGLVKPADLNRPEAKEQFVTNAATIGAVLMNNPSESFLSDSALKQLIANPGFIRNVIALDAIDPEGATVARQYVRSGLNIERGRQVTNFGTIEAYLQDKGIVWNGTAYALTPEAEASGPRVVPSFGGMGAITLSPLQENAEFIRQAMDRRAAIVTIDRAMKALEVPTAETTNRAGGAGSQSTSTSPIVSVVEAGEGFITVRRQNGTEERLEGNRASRNNNPGNIQYGEFAKSAGAIGTDGRFAVFPSYEVGRAAKKKLLWDTKSYSGKTIEEAINRYAPPSENDTKSYVKTVSSAVGVPANTPMSSLSEDQKEVMLDAMERVEGFSGPVFSSSKGPDAASYFNVDKNNLPTGGSIVEIGSAKVVANSSMKPLLNSTAGASSLIKQGADVRLASVLQGPFQDLQKNFGSALVINDGLAKKGTSREKQTPGSRHFHGDALDISTVGMSDEDKLRLVDAALEAGFQGFGFGKNILHIDLGAKRAWAYGNDTFGGVPVADLKTRVQSSSVSPAEISMDPRSPQPSAGGDITTPEVDDKEGAPTGFTLFSDDFNVSPNVTTTTSTAPEAMAADTAALPEAIPAETPTGTQGASELSPAIAVDKDVQAFIQEIAGDPDKSYETEAEFVAAQERGELEPGDTVVVNGDVYVIRKNGTARRLGAVK